MDTDNENKDTIIASIVSAAVWLQAECPEASAELAVALQSVLAAVATALDLHPIVVRVTVEGGVVQQVESPPGVRVIVVDYDNEACGHGSVETTYVAGEEICNA